MFATSSGLGSDVLLPPSCVCPAIMCRWCHGWCNSWWDLYGCCQNLSSTPWLLPLFHSSSLSSLSGLLAWHIIHGLCYRITVSHGRPFGQPSAQEMWFSELAIAWPCLEKLSLETMAGLACNTMVLLCNPSVCVTLHIASFYLSAFPSALKPNSAPGRWMLPADWGKSHT